jgi:4-phytase/acid phosphatase
MRLRVAKNFHVICRPGHGEVGFLTLVRRLLDAGTCVASDLPMTPLMSRSLKARMGRSAFLAIAACLLALATPAVQGDELKLVIILTRHGVRSPLQTQAKLAPYAAQPWPTWEVPPGIQTPRGNELIALMGDYYRARFQKDGLLTGDPAIDGPLVYFRADNDQRTKATTAIIGKALVSTGEPDVHALPEGTKDPLFRPFQAKVGTPNLELASAAILGRVGGDLTNLDRAYAAQFAELNTVLFGPTANPGQVYIAAGEGSVSAGTGTNLTTLKGPIRVAEECVDSFILQYADNKPMSEVGWGRVDTKTLTDLLTLHELFFDLADRTFYSSQVEGSNLASHIVDTLEQGAQADVVPGAIGPAGEKILVLGGHDSNIAAIGGLFGMNWVIAGSQLNPTLPGSALLFELWKRGDAPGTYYVRTSYVSQTLEQMRAATPLTLDNPPARSPISIPGCGGIAPEFETSLASFVRQARKVIDPAFIAPEE